jgi:CRP-like cAMP-binding protein
MIHMVRQYIASQLGDDAEGVDLVVSKFQFIKVTRNTQLLSRGEICRYVYFVAEGCLQSYILDSEMQENTREIITEGNWYSDLRSFTKAEPATENIKTIEASKLFRIERKDFQELIDTVPQFGQIYRKILEAYYNNAMDRINTFISLSSLDRIRWLMQNRPGLMTRLSSKLIASYLGINKDVFSRLKAKL